MSGLRGLEPLQQAGEAGADGVDVPRGQAHGLHASPASLSMVFLDRGLDSVLGRVHRDVAFRSVGAVADPASRRPRRVHAAPVGPARARIGRRSRRSSVAGTGSAAARGWPSIRTGRRSRRCSTGHGCRSLPDGDTRPTRGSLVLAALAVDPGSPGVDRARHRRRGGACPLRRISPAARRPHDGRGLVVGRRGPGVPPPGTRRSHRGQPRPGRGRRSAGAAFPAAARRDRHPAARRRSETPRRRGEPGSNCCAATVWRRPTSAA